MKDIVITYRYVLRNIDESFDPLEYAQSYVPKPSFMIDAEELKESMCPHCGFDTDGFEPHPDEQYVTYSPERTTGAPWDGGIEWDECWTCPDCQKKFEITNGN